MATSTYTSQGWSDQSSSSSPWNAGILLNVPAIMNRYPPGLSQGAWRATPSSRTASSPGSDNGIVTGSKRPRATTLRSGRRAPPPPLQSRVYHAPVAFPSENSYPSNHSLQTHHSSPSNLIIYKSPTPARTHLASQSQSRSAGHSYPFQPQPMDGLAQQQRAAADKEARLRVVASILLNRVNVVGKPMRRRPRIIGLDEPKTYVRSGLGRCVSVAE
jgi:hypothetical protein